MAVKILFCLVAVLFVVEYAKAVNWKQCGGSGKVSTVVVTDCPSKELPCILHTGKNYTFEVDFTTSVASKTLTAKVYGIIGGTPVPFPLKNKNGCNSCGLTCPLNPKKNYKYKSVIPVLKLYPEISLMVRWELVDEKDKEVFCVILPAQIHH